MVNIPADEENLGEEFEYDSSLKKSELISFLEELVQQLKAEDKVTVSILGAQASMSFREPIDLEVECEYTKGGNRKLEVEIEFHEQA
ncbi:MAG: amphi-Trp domain-containing protein [Candidatus Bipolaricaulota bacterium]